LSRSVVEELGAWWPLVSVMKLSSEGVSARRS
jgi:hypothetical protein